MRIDTLQPQVGSRKSAKRLGRGTGSGLGKTSGKGHKGQWARSGGGVRPGFEGGQMPLIRRIPKRGFTNIFAKKYAEINVSELNVFNDGDVIGVTELMEKGIIGKAYDGLVVLGNGEITKKVTVKAARFSKVAAEKIATAGGKAEVI